MRRLLIGLLFAACAPSLALAWGELGHRTVAEVAARNLSEPATGAVARLLEDGAERFVDVATWADHYREVNADTTPWHIVEIPFGAESFERTRDCVGDRCIVAKIKEFAATLADEKSTPATRTLALKFLIHFVGDIHTPLHALAPLNRPGGVWVRIGDMIDSLHLWWDDEFVDALSNDETELADLLEDLFPPERRREWTQGTPEDWANESFVIARAFVRSHGVVDAVRANAVTPDAPMVLPLAIFDEVKPIVAQRLYMAGLRLARLLNEAFE